MVLHKKRHIDKGNKIENSEMAPQIYRKLNFVKQDSIQWKKDDGKK